MKNRIVQLISILFVIITVGQIQGQTYINGPYKTGVNTLSNVANPLPGFQWSEVPYDAPNTTYSSTTAGQNSAKLNATNTSGFTLADDFTIPNTPVGVKWNISSMDFVAYQSGYTGTVSPINEVYVRIWDGNPSVINSTAVVIWGDLTTNRFVSTGDANAHRIFNTVAPAPGTAPGTTRRIWTVRASINTELAAGTYWIEYMTGINNAGVYTSHFAPLVTTLTTRTNVIGATMAQRTLASNTWATIVDTGNPASAADVDLNVPFIVNYAQVYLQLSTVY